VVANSVLVDKHLLAPIGWYRIFMLTAAGLLLAIMLAPFTVAKTGILAPALLILVSALFPALLLFGDIWFDPISVTTVLIGSTVASVVAAMVSQWSVERTLTGRAVYRLPSPLLKQAFRRGGLPNKARQRRSATVVVVAPVARFEPDAPGDRGREADEPASFHKEIARRIRKLGGVVLGEEGATILALFETPGATDHFLDGRRRSAHAGLARDACETAKELLSASLRGSYALRCGVDLGELMFYISPIGGYRATGPAITYARRLCVLARKHGRRVLFGEGAAAACGKGIEEPRFREEGKLVLPGDRERYAFYSLTEIDPPSP
jgi:class 3 adenylate cyclase